MSKHAKPTLIRFYRGDEEGRYALVRDWAAENGWATFTLPASSQIAASLIEGIVDARIVVMESDELVWDIDRVMHERGSEYWVRCQSHVGHVRQTQPLDDWLLMTRAVES